MENQRRFSDGVLPRELISTPMSIAQLWSILWARKRMIIFITGICALATVFVVLKIIPRVYSSTATLLVSQRVDDPVSGGESSNSFGNAAAQIDYHLATQIEFMRTPAVLLPVVEQFNLIENERYMAGYVGDGSDETKKRWAMSSLLKRISIGQRSGSLLINVTVTERDPQSAADIANAIAETYVVDQKQRFFEPARERAGRYSEQLKSLRQKVDEAQAKVAAFRRETGLTDLSGEGPRGGPEASRIEDLERRLTEASAQRLDAELNLSRIRNGDATVLQSSNIIEGLRSRIQASEAKLAELRETLGSRHPDIVALRADLEENRALLAAEIRTHVDGGQAAVSSARAVEARLRAQLEEAKNKELVARTQQDEASQLLRELETATKVYQGALDAFETVRLGTEISAFNVQIVNRAVPPLTSDARQGRVLLMISIVVAGGGSCVLALLLELLNRRVRTREDLEGDLGIPVLVQLQRST